MSHNDDLFRQLDKVVKTQRTNLETENVLLKGDIARLESKLKIYNNWFIRLGANIQSFEGLRDSISGTVCKTTTIIFPEIAFSEFGDIGTINQLRQIGIGGCRCDLCNNGARRLMFDGAPLKFCFECGRALAVGSE